MKHLKSLALSMSLMCVIAVSAVAGETQGPPCAPGELSSPPCIAPSVTDDSVDPGETLAAPTSPVVDVTDITDAVLWALSLF